MKNSSNLNISCKVVFSLNKRNKKVGTPSSFGRKRPFISLNSSASIENLSSSERARARARANHAKNDTQKGCAVQLNGITLRKKSQSELIFSSIKTWCVPSRNRNARTIVHKREVLQLTPKAYKIFLTQSTSIPCKSQEKWLTDYTSYGFDMINWGKSYTTGFLCTNESKIKYELELKLPLE